MAHHTEQAGFPAYALVPGLRVVLEARSPTTDAEVAGVVATRFSIYGYDRTPGDDPLDEVPRWTPAEVFDSGTA